MVLDLMRRGRRFVVMLGGEVLQSAFHFMLNIVLVRLLAPADYGVFAIVMLMGGIALNYMRSLAGMPANLLIPHCRLRPRVLSFEAMTNSAALLFTLLFFVVVAASLELWLDGDAVAGGLFVGLWALRSYVRAFLFAHDAPGTASVSDFVFALCGMSIGGLLFQLGGAITLQNVFLVLSAANSLAIAAALVLHRRPFRMSLRASVRRRYSAMFRQQLVWSTIGVTAGTVQAQGQVLLIAALAGPAAYAPIAAMLVVLAPLRLIASALANMAQPEIATLAAKGDEEAISRRRLFWTGAMVVVSLGYAVAMVVAVPLLGSKIFAGQPRELIGLFAWGISIMPLLYIMPKVHLEVLRRFELIAGVNTAAAVVGMALVAVLLIVATPAWSMLGNLVSELVVLWCSWAAVLGRGLSGASRASRPIRLFPSPREVNP